MDKAIMHKILDIQDTFRKDPEYQHLVEENQMRNARFLEIEKTLTQKQRDAVFDYIGLLIEIHLRTLEYALKE